MKCKNICQFSRFKGPAHVNEQEIKELLDHTAQKNTVFVYIIKQLYHSLFVVRELIANSVLRASLTMSSYTTPAYGIIVKYQAVNFISNYFDSSKIHY